MKLADRKLPTSLARLADVEHVTVSPGRRSDPEKRELFDRHSSHCFKGRDTDYYPQNYWKFCSQGDVILKAHCFEIARCFFWKKLPFESLPDAGMIAWSFGEDSETLVRALREWTTWIERNPIENLDWRDRFYYEQRLAGWCSAHMQSNDLVGTEVLVPTNAHSILSLLLSVGLEKRRAGEHQLDLIRRMSPQLLELPVNRSTSFHPLARIYWHVRYGTLWNALGSKALRKLGKMIE
jgi:hypothetical protein